MSLSTSLRAGVKKALTIVSGGSTITVKRISNSGYTPESLEPNSSSTITYTGYGYPGNYKKSEIDGETIKRQDIKLIFYSNDGTRPLIDDEFEIDSVKYRAMNVDIYKMEGIDAAYTVQLRI